MKKISISVQQQILFLASKKLSLREIAEKVQLGKSTVSRYLKQAKIQKSSSKAGRPCTISSRLRDVLIRNFLVGKFLNCTDAIKYLKNVVDVTVSKETIRLLLRNAGLKSYKRALKPRLLSIHKKNRRAFARAMKPVDKETWESIIFTMKASTISMRLMATLKCGEFLEILLLIITSDRQLSLEVDQ